MNQVFRLSFFWDEIKRASDVGRLDKLFFDSLHQLRADLSRQPVVADSREGREVYFPSEHRGG